MLVAFLRPQSRPWACSKMKCLLLRSLASGLTRPMDNEHKSRRSTDAFLRACFYYLKGYEKVRRRETVTLKASCAWLSSGILERSEVGLCLYPVLCLPCLKISASSFSTSPHPAAGVSIRIIVIGNHSNTCPDRDLE